MNLARFGLTKNDQNEIVPDGSIELVEISEAEAKADPTDVQVIELLPEFSLDSRSGRSEATKKYVKRKKNTSKQFIQRMKKKHELIDLDKPIRDMSKTALLANFKAKRKNKAGKYVIDKKKFAFNVIWNLYQEIEVGRVPEFAKVSCNVRSIFYYMKTVIREHASIFNDADNIYDNFSRAVLELVLAGLISYKDFNIVDDRRAYRLLPPAYGNTNIILLAEKDSFVGRFFELGSQYGVVAQITKGRGSVLMADSMLTEMYEAGYDMEKQFSILSFCDFDPVGTSVPYHFAKHLRQLGFTNIRNFSQYGEATKTVELSNGNRKKLTQVRPCLDIVNPRDLPTDVRNKLKHPMPRSIQNNPSTADWAFITGGVTGTGNNKRDAISSEMLLPYLAEHLDEKIRPLLEKPPETFGRRLGYEYIRSAIREYIGARAERGLLEGF